MDRDRTRIIIEAVQYWQNDDSIHPLTCINNGNDKLIASYSILDGNVYLICPKCGWIQREFPKDLVLNHFNNRHKKDKKSWSEVHGLPEKLFKNMGNEQK